jgi:hypothetical protein
MELRSYRKKSKRTGTGTGTGYRRSADSVLATELIFEN